MAARVFGVSDPAPSVAKGRGDRVAARRTLRRERVWAWREETELWMLPAVLLRLWRRIRGKGSPGGGRCGNSCRWGSDHLIDAIAPE